MGDRGSMRPSLAPQSAHLILPFLETDRRECLLWWPALRPEAALAPVTEVERCGCGRDWSKKVALVALRHAGPH